MPGGAFAFRLRVCRRARAFVLEMLAHLCGSTRAGISDGSIKEANRLFKAGGKGQAEDAGEDQADDGDETKTAAAKPKASTKRTQGMKRKRDEEAEEEEEVQDSGDESSQEDTRGNPSKDKQRTPPAKRRKTDTRFALSGGLCVSCCNF
jgi:hypothetical protein